jgi:hypothetical protein
LPAVVASQQYCGHSALSACGLPVSRWQGKTTSLCLTPQGEPDEFLNTPTAPDGDLFDAFGKAGRALPHPRPFFNEVGLKVASMPRGWAGSRYARPARRCRPAGLPLPAVDADRSDLL